MKTLILSLFLLLAPRLFGQSVYTGTMDGYPIELVIDVYSDGDARAHYAYTKWDAPLVVNGRLSKESLTLYEESGGQVKATFRLEGFSPSQVALTGVWTEAATGLTRKVHLQRAFQIAEGEGVADADRELLQAPTLGNRYFRLVVSKNKEDHSARVTAVKVFEKGSDRLLQQLPLDCQLSGIDATEIDDYNFDGKAEFSVFEASAAGPNTSRVYFLFQPSSGRFIPSGFTGTSLEFDAKTKRVYEHNQCCAGTSHINAEYKIVNNKMVLVKKTCLKWNEKRGALMPVKCD